MIKACTGLCLLVALFSCNLKPEQEPEALARVNDSYLFREEIRDLVPPGTPASDSAAIIRNYIDRWASRKLLINAAEINLSAAKKSEFDALVNEYKLDLYTKGYLEEIVKRSVDSVISEEELEAYYKDNKENFRTNGVLVRLRYIHLSKDNPKYEAIKARFFDFRKSDKKFWETYALQMKDFALNDSVWVDMGQVYSRLKFINPENRDQYVSSGKSIQHPDGNEMYFVKITNVLDKNQVSPFDYIKPVLREVILNKRKLELIKKFEKDITDDAIKDKKYEIYK